MESPAQSVKVIQYAFSLTECDMVSMIQQWLWFLCSLITSGSGTGSDPGGGDRGSDPKG